MSDGHKREPLAMTTSDYIDAHMNSANECVADGYYFEAVIHLREVIEFLIGSQDSPMNDTARKPPDDALWSLALDTRFGPDYLWLEPASLMDGSFAVNLNANETIDPVDSWRQTDILLRRADLERLREGVDRAIGWLDERNNSRGVSE